MDDAVLPGADGRDPAALKNAVSELGVRLGEVDCAKVADNLAVLAQHWRIVAALLQASDCGAR